MLKCSLDDGFGSLSSMHVPIHLILIMEFCLLIEGYLGSSENITVLRSMLSPSYKSFVITGRIPRERVLSNAID